MCFSSEICEKDHHFQYPVQKLMLGDCLPHVWLWPKVLNLFDHTQFAFPVKNYCFQRADPHPVHVRERSNCSLRLDACSPLFMHSTVVASSGGAAREFVRCTVNVQAACVGTAVE